MQYTRFVESIVADHSLSTKNIFIGEVRGGFKLSRTTFEGMPANGPRDAPICVYNRAPG